MAQSRISYGIQGLSLNGREDATLRHLEKLDPTWVLVLDSRDLAVRAANRLPRTNVIFRRWPDDDLVHRVGAEQWVLQTKAAFGDDRLWAYAGNEQGWSVQAVKTVAKATRRAAQRAFEALASPRSRLVTWFLALFFRVLLTTTLKLESYQAISVVKWNIEVIKFARLHNLKVVVGNFSSGTPGPDDWKHPLAQELLRLLHECRNFAVLGLHEYACGVITSGFVGGWPQWILPEDWPTDVRGLTMWHCGRYTFLIRACEQLGVPVPRIVITEFGMDDMSDIKAWTETLPKTPGYSSIRGWKSLQSYWQQVYGPRGWNAEYTFYRKADYADKVIYYHPAIEALLLFCLGASSSLWEQFNLLYASSFQELLERRQNAEPPPVEPEVPASGPYILRRANNGVSNLRSSPDDSSTENIIGQLADKTWIRVKSVIPKGQNKYAWLLIETVDKEGMIALLAKTSMWFEPATTDQDPSQEPRNVTVKDLQDLIAIEREIANMIEQVSSAQLRRVELWTRILDRQTSATKITN